MTDWKNNKDMDKKEILRKEEIVFGMPVIHVYVKGPDGSVFSASESAVKNVSFDKETAYKRCLRTAISDMEKYMEHRVSLKSSDKEMPDKKGNDKEISDAEEFIRIIYNYLK